ncbi:hypothetical protein GF345_03060 [Candidatus Woesearchaeota archaeon]|nr:hypothetical protein [Candidatus Woesearchaeota archaeon]
MAEQSKKITMYIFLFALFIMLAFFLGTHIYNIYVQGTTSSSETTKGSLECSFSFSIRMIDYEFPELTFDLRTTDIEALDTIVIEVEDIQTEVPLKEFFDFQQNIVVDDVVIEDTFLVYPEGCRNYNKKECSVKTKECEVVR